MRLQFLLYPFIYTYYLVSYLITLPFYLIKLFILGLYFSFYFVVNNIFLLMAILFKQCYRLIKYFILGIKSIVINFISGLNYLIKISIGIIKYFILGFNLTIGKVFFGVWLIIRLFGYGLYTIFYQVVKFFKVIINAIMKVFKTVAIAIAKAFKEVYRIFKKGIDTIIYTIRNSGKIFKHYINKINNFINSFIRTKKQVVVDWYNNLAFVKNKRNRQDFNRKVLLIDFEAESGDRSEQKIPYKFVAKNKDGKIITGYFDAYSKVDVHSFLLAEGAEVYSIETSKYIQFMANLGRNKNYRVSYKDLAFILTQLSTYIKSGITLVDSLKIISRQTKNAQRKKIFDAVIYEVVMGANFSEALEKQGPAFPKLLINMIKTSELTGQLSEVLDNMAEYYDSVQKTRSQMKTAMLYPSVVFVMAVGVIVFVMIAIIPQFIEMFKNMETEIPKITRIVINTSDFMQNNILYLAIGALLLIIFLRFLYSSVKAFRYIIQWLMMHLPVIGKIIIYNEVTMFAKTFGSLLIHNVYITESMEILSRITDNEIYKFLIFDTISNLGRGDEISKAFKNHWAFPIIAYEMLVTGERTGEVGVMMNKVGDYYAEQHKLAIGQIKSFIEPVMIIFLASTVGTILLSIIVPMFSMYQQF